jgi:hypothetical protein
MKLKIILGAVVLSLLVACGGSGGGGSAAAPTSESTTGSNQLPTNLPAIKSLTAMALQTPSASQVSQWKNALPFYAKARLQLNQIMASLQEKLIPNAYAQSSSSSSTSSSQTSSNQSTVCSVKNLVGVNSDGTSIDLSLTSGASGECVGVTDMFDGKTYVLLATEGIYKDGKTCNLVFAQKSTGSLFCLGEKSRSRYTFTRKDGSNWKKYDILQATDNGNYIFLETKVDIYDTLGSKTGELVKVLRFDLTDSINGPSVMTVLEAENTSWYSWSNSGDTTWFTLYGYSGLENGDMAATYQYSINNYTFSSNNYINDSTYFAYNASAGNFDSVRIDLSSLNSGSSSYWYQQIKCYLGGATTTANGVDTSNFYFVADVGGSKLYKAHYNGTAVVTQDQGQTNLCANWYGSSAIAKIDGEYYGVTQNTQRVQSAWNWSTGQGQVGIDLYKRDLNSSQDVVIAEMTTQRSWANPQMAVSTSGRKAYVVLGAAEQWIWNSLTSSSTRVQNGAEIFYIDLANYVNTPIQNVTPVVTSADKIWVSTLSNVGSDGLLQFAGRDMATPMFNKIDVTVDPVQSSVNRRAADSAGNGGETLVVVRL